MPDLLTPQFAIPFRVVAGQLAEIEQDSEEEIIQNAEVILRYTTGDRSVQPEFGAGIQELRQGGADLDALTRSVRRWEPDASVEAVREALTADGMDLSTITLGKEEDLG